LGSKLIYALLKLSQACFITYRYSFTSPIIQRAKVWKLTVELVWN